MWTIINPAMNPNFNPDQNADLNPAVNPHVNQDFNTYFNFNPHLPPDENQHRNRVRAQNIPVPQVRRPYHTLETIRLDNASGRGRRGRLNREKLGRTTSAS